MVALPDPSLTAYKEVPKDLSDNLEYRRAVLLSGYESPEAANALWTLCKRDILFYINTFLWTYDPRLPGRGLPPDIPFVTYEFQDEALLEIVDAIADHDLLIEKSRDMGASWMTLTVIDWLWRFGSGYTFLLLSRKEELVDKRGDKKALFWKLDYIHSHLPVYLRPRIHRAKLHLGNLDTNSTIDGESTTGDAGRGDRRTAIFPDEFASVPEGHNVLNATRDASNCRIFNSTPKGTGNAFYDLTQTSIKKLRLHWPSHPVKAKGLYHDKAGNPRSPWYDGECARAAHPMEIAQELDIDYAGSDAQFFDPPSIQQHIDEHGMPPLWRGRLEYDPLSLRPERFVPERNGPLLLWMHLDGNNNPPSNTRYVVGSDVATGSKDFTGRGASNSCAMIGDASKGEKVGALVCNGVHPHDFAKQVVALCEWLKGSDKQPAFLIWEANGPGRIFGETVIECGFRHFFYRKNEKTLTKNAPTTTPGFYTTKDTKVALLGKYRQALQSGRFINHDVDALRECLDYVYTTSGSIEFSRTVKSVDPSMARENHGDRVIGDALCCRGMDEFSSAKAVERIVVPNSIFGRRQERLKKIKEASYW